MTAGFRPSAFLSNPDDFGRTHDPQWLPQPEHLRPDLAAADAQHRLALAVRHRHPDDTAQTWADATGALRPDYILRKLNGQIPLTYKDFMHWQLLLDPQRWPADRLGTQLDERF